MIAEVLNPTVNRFKFSVAEYYALAQAGILGADVRVELIDGEIVNMSPINPQHASQVDKLAALFFNRLPGRAMVRQQNPVRLSDDSEPQPDVALVLPEADRYKKAHPKPSEVLLIVEVSDTTLNYDRGTKVPLYARAGIPEVWLVSLSDNRLEVYRHPEDRDYRERLLLRLGDSLSPLAFPDVTFSVQEILE